MTLQLSRAIRRERKSAEGGTTKKNARRSFRRARRRRRCALVSFASRFVRRFLFLFARIGNAKTVVCLVFFELLFSLEKEREKTVPTREISTRAPRLVGERDATKTRAKKDNVASRTFSFERIRRAQGVFVCACVCSRTKVESRKARARLAKNFVWRLFPLEKKKNILAFAPFFCPLCSFFFLFWARFCPFFGKKWREILVSQFRVLVFSSLLQHAIMDSSFPMYG